MNIDAFKNTQKLHFLNIFNKNVSMMLRHQERFRVGKDLHGNRSLLTM